MENIQFDTFTFRKYPKLVSVTEVSDVVSLFTQIAHPLLLLDIAEFWFSYVKVIPVQANSTILVTKGLLMF